MAWVEFTKPIPGDRRPETGGLWVLPRIIESWQRWFQDKGIRTKVERINGKWILYKWEDKNAPLIT